MIKELTIYLEFQIFIIIILTVAYIIDAFVNKVRAYSFSGRVEIIIYLFILNYCFDQQVTEQVPRTESNERKTNNFLRTDIYLNNILVITTCDVIQKN